VWVLALSASVVAESPVKARPSAPYRTWIEQLGSPSYRLREEATRQLEAEGLKALPALQEALGSEDAEVRRRARALIPAIEMRALLSPRRINLAIENKTLRDIVDELQRQTGYKIEFWSPDPARTYTFTIKDRTYWEAMDQICTMTHLSVQQNYGDDIVRLQQGEHCTDYVRYDGPFRFVPLGIQQTRYMPLNQPHRGLEMPQVTENLNFSFLVCSEPRLPLLGMGQPKIEAAYDNQKCSMVPPSTNTFDPMDFRFGMGRRWVTRYGGGNRCCQIQADLSLVRSSNKATTIKELRGYVPVTLLAEQKPVVLADDVLKSKGKKITVGTTTFLFEEASEVPATKQIQVKVSVTENSPEGANDYTWMNTLYSRIELQDSKGNRYQTYTTNWNNTAPNHVQLTLTFGTVGATKMVPPARFIFQNWKTVQHVIPFEFRDIPLP
jgi:hypothetical protein